MQPYDASQERASNLFIYFLFFFFFYFDRRWWKFCIQSPCIAPIRPREVDLKFHAHAASNQFDKSAVSFVSAKDSTRALSLPPAFNN